MKKSKKSLILSGFLLLSALSLSACGGSKTPSDSASSVQNGSSSVSSNETSSSVSSETSSSSSETYETITVAEALALCGDTPGYTSTDRYYIRATVKSIDNANYGAMTIYDSTGEISVYGTLGKDGVDGYAALESKPVAGDEVLLSCILQNYQGNKEVKSGWIIEFTHNDPVYDEKDYETMTIAAARDAVADKKVKVSGVVARITYANGHKASGFYLVDSTGSIYVYDSQIAPQVSVGNTITIAASKTFYVLETEKEYAEQYGYTGCCQLSEGILIENDKGNTAYDTSWIQEKTIKEIVETPVSENVTTTIYKTTALLSKKEGTGFVNYYFNDLDGTTGSYVYTQCNGSDFDWLDEFDGKIVTAYLSPINAKSTVSGCLFRFQPITVIDESYTFDLSGTAKFIVDYYAKDQFLTHYTGDPVKELITSVSSELLGFENATISYSSDNTDVVYFEEVDGKTILHTKDVGVAEITITGTYSTYESYTETLSIRVSTNEDVEALTVSEAITSPVGDEIIVRGIVGPSLVNKVGFYLIDETGAIAVQVSDEVMSLLALGNEVVIKGTRAHREGTSESMFGQSYIDNPTIVDNKYGNNDYSTQSFDTGKTLADLLSLDSSIDQTTQVYTIQAQVKFIETAYYSNAYLTDGTNDFQLYTSSGSQYSWLKDYGEATLTVEVAIVNWNGKAHKLALLSVTDESGVKTYNTHNFSK